MMMDSIKHDLTEAQDDDGQHQARLDRGSR